MMVWLGWSAGKTAASSNGLVTFYVRCRVDRVICSLMIEMRCPTTHDTTLEQNGKCVLRFFFLLVKHEFFNAVHLLNQVAKNAAAQLEYTYKISVCI